jgi:mRNA interferase MazF
MAIFEQGDVVKVPFPYTDQTARQYRPALVVSAPRLESSRGLLWVVMITSAENRGWDGDLPIARHAAAGLPAPSVIRCAKIATIEAAQATRLGCIPPELRRKVAATIRSNIGEAASAGR